MPRLSRTAAAAVETLLTPQRDELSGSEKPERVIAGVFQSPARIGGQGVQAKVYGAKPSTRRNFRTTSLTRGGGRIAPPDSLRGVRLGAPTIVEPPEEVETPTGSESAANVLRRGQKIAQGVFELFIATEASGDVLLDEHRALGATSQRGLIGLPRSLEPLWGQLGYFQIVIRGGLHRGVLRLW